MPRILRRRAPPRQESECQIRAEVLFTDARNGQMQAASVDASASSKKSGYLLAVKHTSAASRAVRRSRTGETGVIVDRLPPGRQCAESDDDVRALAAFMAVSYTHLTLPTN